jgi:hypothetical protein
MNLNEIPFNETIEVARQKNKVIEIKGLKNSKQTVAFINKVKKLFNFKIMPESIGFEPDNEECPRKMDRREWLKMAAAGITAAAVEGIGIRRDKIPKEELSPGSSIETVQPPKFIEADPASPEAELIKDDSIIDNIDTAWNELANQEAGFELRSVPARQAGKGSRRREIKPKLIHQLRYNVLLAVLDLKSERKEIEFVKVDQNGVSERPEFAVEKGMPIGMGTKYEVSSPSGYAVLAVKRALRLGGGYEEVRYSPYTPALDCQVVRSTGFNYLKSQLSQAQTDFKDKQVKSRAYEDKLIADVIPAKVSLALSIIEHVDPNRFERLSEKFQQSMNQEIGDVEAMKLLANEIFTTVGANRESSYAYAVSKAGARGLFQFIPQTYANIRGRYARAKLDEDFAEGMNNHVNGAKASLLLFDSDLSFLSVNRRNTLLQSPEVMGMYLASAYNSGAPRTAKAIDQHGADWRKHILPETQKYVRKFLAVYRALQK